MEGGGPPSSLGTQQRLHQPVLPGLVAHRRLASHAGAVRGRLVLDAAVGQGGDGQVAGCLELGDQGVELGVGSVASSPTIGREMARKSSQAPTSPSSRQPRLTSFSASQNGAAGPEDQIASIRPTCSKVSSSARTVSVASAATLLRPGREPIRYYRCPGRREKVCEAQHVRAKEADASVIEHLASHSSPPELVALTREEL